MAIFRKSFSQNFYLVSRFIVDFETFIFFGNVELLIRSCLLPFTFKRLQVKPYVRCVCSILRFFRNRNHNTSKLVYSMTLSGKLAYSRSLMSKRGHKHCVKSVFIWSSSGPYFLASDGITDLLCKSPYIVRMWENTDQKNSKYGYFSWS